MPGPQSSTLGDLFRQAAKEVEEPEVDVEQLKRDIVTLLSRSPFVYDQVWAQFRCDSCGYSSGESARHAEDCEWMAIKARNDW